MSQENANRSVPPLLIVAALCVPLLAVSLYIALRPDVELPNANAPQQRTLRDSTVEVGGIRRPKSDILAGQQRDLVETDSKLTQVDWE